MKGCPPPFFMEWYYRDYDFDYSETGQNKIKARDKWLKNRKLESQKKMFDKDGKFKKRYVSK